MKFTKTLMAAAVASAIVGMAVPAGAALPPLKPETAKLTDGTSAKRAGTATLGFDGTQWHGRVHVRAGVLAPGTYVYGAFIQLVGGGSGDVLCSFTITRRGQAGGCHGTSPHLTNGFWGTLNYAEVYTSTGGTPILQGLYH